MLAIFAKSFMTAARAEERDSTNHWGEKQRFDRRREAEIEAHTTARRRD
ncbi:hypothetical protein [Roseovarius spongiae]|nr:hypothetical protein [Roseovarius spongiae]